MRRPTVREGQHLIHASRHPRGCLPTAVNARLVKAMLAEDWIYREDMDGYRLEADEALGYRGGTPWRITDRGRWTALTVRQRRLLGELAESRPTPARRDARATALVEAQLAEEVGETLRLTTLGRRLVRDSTQRREADQP